MIYNRIDLMSDQNVYLLGEPMSGMTMLLLFLVIVGLSLLFAWMGD